MQSTNAPTRQADAAVVQLYLLSFAILVPMLSNVLCTAFSITAAQLRLLACMCAGIVQKTDYCRSCANLMSGHTALPCIAHLAHSLCAANCTLKGARHWDLLDGIKVPCCTTRMRISGLLMLTCVIRTCWAVNIDRRVPQDSASFRRRWYQRACR